jgi:magnesium transporter
MTEVLLSHDELYEAWPILSNEDRVEGFKLLSRIDAEELFFKLDSRDQADLLLELHPAERRIWLRLLAPDDAADLVQAAPADQRDALLALFDDRTRQEVVALLAYAEDQAGGLMNPRYARLRPDMGVDEAISYLRRQSREHVESIYYAYVLDPQQHLLGVVSLRELVTAAPDKRVRDVMESDVVTVTEETDQEAVSNLFAQHNLTIIPVVDADRRMKGIVTGDDIIDVVREEATEDMQKIAGVQALEAPYLQIGLLEMVRKRAVWLVVLFVGQMLTATVLSFYQRHLEAAVVLALFMPLIISSGGNSGSQAATLVVRALALGEIRLNDWLRIIRREVAVGLTLGAILGIIGLARILIVHGLSGAYGTYAMLLGATIACSLVGVVVWGTAVGCLLPLLLRRLGLDPATASAPFVATLADVTGLIIYFSIATSILHGTLL